MRLFSIACGKRLVLLLFSVLKSLAAKLTQVLKKGKPQFEPSTHEMSLQIFIIGVVLTKKKLFNFISYFVSLYINTYTINTDDD